MCLINLFLFLHMCHYMKGVIWITVIYLSYCWWTLSCLHESMTNSGVNILKQETWWTFACISLGNTPRIGIIGHTVCVLSVLLVNVKLISPQIVRKTVTVGSFEWFLVMLDFEAGSAGKNLIQGRLLFHLHSDSKCDLVEELERKHSVIGIRVLL